VTPHSGFIQTTLMKGLVTTPQGGRKSVPGDTAHMGEVLFDEVWAAVYFPGASSKRLGCQKRTTWHVKKASKPT